MTIAIVSDIHATGKGKSKRLISEAFDAINEHKADLVLSAGDNVNGCQKAEYEALSASIQNHLGSIPIYCAFGNHDYFSNHPEDVSDENARSSFLNQLFEQNKTINHFKNGIYSLYFENVHIIFLDCVQNRRNFFFDEEQAQWLENELEKSREDRFRIIVNHLPLAIHNLGAKRKVNTFMAGNNRLQSIIDKYSNIIYVSGHTHNRIDSDYPNAERDENGNIYLNGGSVGNTQPCLEDIKKLKPLRNSLPKDSEEYKEINRYFKMGSMGLFLDIRDDCFHIRGYDFIRNEYISRCDFVFN